MPLWGSIDNAANSDIAVLPQLNRPTTAAERTKLYGNTQSGQYFTGMTIGQYAVDTNEVSADPTGHGLHSGWVLRKVGSGLRAGRVTTEVLVAMGSISGDVSGETVYPDYTLSITNPVSNTSRWGVPVTFNAPAVSRPAGATISYTWQINTGSGWEGVTDGGVYANSNTSHLNISNNALLNNAIYRANANTAGVNTTTTLTTANAVLSVTLYTLDFPTQPVANAMGTGNAVSFSVVANSVPAGAAITYQWQKKYGANPFVNITTGGIYDGANTNTLTISNNATLNANTFRVTIDAPGALANANSAQVLLTVL